MPFTVSLFACAMIDNSDFTNHHSKCTSSTVILLPHLHQCWLSTEKNMVCNTPRMVLSVVTRHSYDSHPCHFAHTRDNQCSSSRTMEWFECTMHIACIHPVVTSLVCIHQPWWVFQHQVCCCCASCPHVVAVVVVVSQACHHHD